MEYCVLRKVAYRLPGTNRLVWAVILSEAEGLSLLFVRKPDEKRSHTIALATENVSNHYFEDAPNASRFPMENQDLAEIGGKLQALGENLSNEEFHKRFFRPDDSWWRE